MGNWEKRLKQLGFDYCPFCGEENSGEENRPFKYALGAIKSTWSCTKCGAKWQPVMHFPSANAKLVSATTDGKGKELLQKGFDRDFWRKMGIAANLKLSAKKGTTGEEPKIVTKEVIKEVFVKIRCAYCQRVYDESHDKCPHCGASR